MVRSLFQGLLAVLASALSLHAAPAAPAMEFIKADGDRLVEGTREFRYLSVNMPDVLQIISNYRFDGNTAETRYRLPDDYEQRDAIRTVKQLGGRVVRTFVISCSTEDNPNTMFNVATNPVVPNEAALRVLDRLLQISDEEGVRILVPLIAYNSRVRGDPTTYGPDFWKVGSPTNLKFKNMLTQLLGRTNSFTGVRYRDEPALFGWHTGNELVIGDNADRRQWLHDIAAYIKQLDPNHLLIDGRNRPDDVYNRYDEFASDRNLDAVSYHTYGNLTEANTPVGTLRLMRNQLRGKKPLLVTEVAMWTPPATLRALFDEIIADGTVGANFWAVRFHNRDGGFYKHSDNASQFEDLNWPGFTDPKNYLPEIAKERELLTIIHDYAGRISGTAAEPTTPLAPFFLPSPDVGHLSWRGSTGASDYEIQRSASHDGPWVTLQPHFQENLIVYNSLFCDSTAEDGHSYFYRLLARNATGVSAPSNVVGPLSSNGRWLIDELFDLSLADPASNNLTIEKAYAHDRYLEDVALAVRQDAARPGTLVYRVAGDIRSVSLAVFDIETLPQLFIRQQEGARRSIDAKVTRYDGHKRGRFQAELPANSGGTLEIVLPAEAAPKQAIGRVEIAWTTRHP